jgi:beta-glucanase (GH16 family)
MEFEVHFTRRTLVAIGVTVLAVAGVSGWVLGRRKSPTTVEPASPWVLTFSEDFDGTMLSPSRWIDSYPHNMRTHSNNEQQYYATDSYRVKEGFLYLTASKKAQHSLPYTSGMVSSFGKFSQQFGKFEIRAKFPKGKGLWPAFWLLPQSEKWPPEIDVLEILGHDMHTVYMTNHWRQGKSEVGDKALVQRAQHEYHGPDFSADFHTFTLEWEATEIRWYVDGVLRATSSEHVPQEPMYVLANLAVGGDWPGMPDAKTPFPSTMTIDYIRAYRLR